MSPRVTVGHAIGGRFAVARLVGSGPMGEVVEVRDQGSGVAYACKVLFPAVAQSAAWAAFADESRRASSLGPAVARVLETGFEDSASAPFVLSELISAPSLAARLATGAPLSPHAAAGLVRALVAPLGAAHSAGFAHRDLVPTNVFVDDAGAVKITDFAIATLRAAVPPATGAFPLGWVPPEQVQGAAPAPTMDVYGVGLLAFFALTGRSPFAAFAQPTLDPSALWVEMTSPLPALSERARQLGGTLPPALDAWFSRALAVDPSMRFPSIREMADAMETALGPAPGQPVKGLKGTMVMGPSGADVAAEVQRRQLQLGNAPTQAQPGYTPSPQPVPPSVAALAPDRAPAPVYGNSLPGDDPDGIPGVPSKKSNKLILAGIGVGVGALLLGGLLVALLSRGKEAPSTDAPGASASATAAPPPSGSAAEPPPAAASASAAPESTGAPDSLVTLKCDPDCDEVRCDGKKIDAAAGVRVKPGKHTCVASKKGYVPSADRFATTAGEDAARTVTLTKLPDAKPGSGKKKCKGTFLSNCN